MPSITPLENATSLSRSTLTPRVSSSDSSATNRVSPNPTPPSGDTWEYGSANPPLFGISGTPALQDVVQGNVSDCYLTSDLEHLASSSPDFIKSHIREVANPADAQHPNYEVDLYDANGKPQTITVDGKELTDINTQTTQGTGSNLGATHGQGAGQALWPTIYEKAFAIMTGKDMTSLNLGLPSEAWSTLTGAAGRVDYMPSMNEFVKQVQTPGQNVSVGTSEGFTSGRDDKPMVLANGRYTVTGLNEDGIGVMKVVDNQSPDKQSWLIPTGHALMVNGVTSLDPSKDPATTTDPDMLRVNLSNPWGPSITNISGLQDVPFSVLKRVCDTYFVLDRPSEA